MGIPNDCSGQVFRFSLDHRCLAEPRGQPRQTSVGGGCSVWLLFAIFSSYDALYSICIRPQSFIFCNLKYWWGETVNIFSKCIPSIHVTFTVYKVQSSKTFKDLSQYCVLNHTINTATCFTHDHLQVVLVISPWSSNFNSEQTSNSQESCHNCYWRWQWQLLWDQTAAFALEEPGLFFELFWLCTVNLSTRVWL